MTEPWQMFRIYLDNQGQQQFVNRLIAMPPEFPFSFNRYFGNQQERDHVQFRFPKQLKETAINWLTYANSEPDYYTYEVFDWLEHPATIIDMQIATKMALLFLKETGAEMRTTPMQMTETLHYFLNLLGYSYFDEEELALSIRNFWKTRRDLQKEFTGA